MKKAGFCNVFIGIESGNNEDLKLYNKNSTVEHNKMIIDLFEREQIRLKYGFIMFNPYSTLERLNENYQFLTALKCSSLELYTSVMELYYGTAMYNYAKRDGLLTEDYNYKDSFGYKYKDKRIENIAQFISEKFTSNIVLGAQCTNHYLLSCQINRANTLLDDLKDINDHFKNQEERLFNEIQLFFKLLLEENNLDLCEKKSADFLSNLSEIYNDDIKIYLKLERKYKKSGIFNTMITI